GMKEDHGVRIHDMRGTWKLNAMEAGIDKVYRDRILGHSLTGIDKYYVEKRLKNREDLLTKAMDRYTTWLDEEIMKVQEQELKCKS
ncbi:MAG TPA: hypothetical protein PLM29_12770, partial [Deltaproteobacteria bacterium]|nr:hypothetical protein [Deltaproteobacteria bacterium]